MSAQPRPYPRVPVRWWIFVFMFAVGFVAYLEQKTLMIAAEPMEPELSLTQLQIGWLRTAFVLGYAAFQFPAGLIGAYFGARRTFVYAGVLAIASMLAMPALPGYLHGDALFVAMLTAQLLLGVSQSVVWPVSAGVISQWFPSSRWVFVIGLQTMSLSLASMVTPPLVEHLMTAYGWQRAFVAATLPAIPLVILWGWYGRNSPHEHPSVTAAELAELDTPPPKPPGEDPGLVSRVKALLRNRHVMLLAFSYLCMNYLFYLLGDWVFIYLRQARGLSLPDSGWLASLPSAGAALGAFVGGIIATWTCRSAGYRWGLRLIPLIAMPTAGMLLLLTSDVSSVGVAILCLTAAYAAVEINESAYWVATMNAASGETMGATGILNTGGNLGGVVASPIIGYFSGLQQWDTTLYIGAGFAAVSAVLWLLIDGAPRPHQQATQASR